jgi:hypothetical protein
VAIGADLSLPKSQPSPLRGLTAQPARQQSSPSYGYRPPMLNDGKVQDVVSNQLASSAGAGQAAMQGMDRAGVSRGRGQQYRADMAQAGADVQSRARAAQTEMGASAANANAQMAYDTAMRNEQLSNAGLLDNLRNNEAMERLAQQGRRQDLNETRRRGQFGLDQIQLDYTPLLGSLFQ